MLPVITWFFSVFPHNIFRPLFAASTDRGVSRFVTWCYCALLAVRCKNCVVMPINCDHAHTAHHTAMVGGWLGGWLVGWLVPLQCG